MTRKEQIDQAARKAFIIEPDDFQLGAEWADNNPEATIIDLIHQRSIAFDLLNIATEALEFVHWEKDEQEVYEHCQKALEKIRGAK